MTRAKRVYVSTVYETPNGAHVAGGIVDKAADSWGFRRHRLSSVAAAADLPGTVPPADDGTGRRWEIALHEAGHVVAGKHLLANEPVAAVLPDIGGVTFLRLVTVPTPTLAGALCIAAGNAAAALAHEHAAPAEAPEPAQAVRRELPTSETAHHELADDFHAGANDAEILGRWAWSGGVGAQAHADRRLARLCNEAAYFVNEHREEILTVARALYARGIYIPQQERGVS